MRPGERQVSPTLDGIRADHQNRYKWAIKHTIGRVTDLACGVGYGSVILAEAGIKVRALDIDAEAIAYAKQHYSHPLINYHCADIFQAGPYLSDTTIAFECIEHVEKPIDFLKQIEGNLLASVPNESVFPYKNYAYHFRHYTKQEFKELLNEAGFRVESWWGQAGPKSDVVENLEGRTIIAKCSHGA